MNVDCNRHCELTPRNVHPEASHFLDCDIWPRIGPWTVPASRSRGGSPVPIMAAEPRGTAPSEPLGRWATIVTVACYSGILLALIVILAVWFKVF